MFWNNCFEVSNKTHAYCLDKSITYTRMAVCFSALISGIICGIVGYYAYNKLNSVTDQIIDS